MHLTKNYFISMLCLCSLVSCAQPKKVDVSTQDSAFTIQTLIDINELKKYNNVFDFDHFKKDSVMLFRNFLKPYVDKNDIYAYHLYARTYDLSPFGLGTSKDAAIALSYYKKAAEQNLAIAEYLLFRTYRYYFMGVEPDAKKSLAYLRSAILHGNNELKSEAYSQLASIYDISQSDTFFNAIIKPNTDSTILYLKKSVNLNPKHTWAIDYLASMYEDKKMYNEAMDIYLKSDNEQSILKVARWLIEGKCVSKNVERGLKLIYPIAEQIQKEYPDNSYMGSVNPVYELNNLYICKKLITKEQVGKYLIANWICN